MVFAIPCNHNGISNHFSKALKFLIVDDNHRYYATTPSVKRGEGCNSKNIIALLQKNKVDAVVVKSVGTEMLSRLFSHQYEVFKTDSRGDATALKLDELQPVSDLSVARPSGDHEKKHKLKHCCNGCMNGYCKAN